jgi:hypothetical protein
VLILNTTATTYGHVWNVSPDGQSWNFYYLRGYNELQFTVANGVVSDGLLDNWTDYDPWYSWENKFTNLTGTVAVVTPLPAALPLFATGLGVMGLLGWRRRRKAAMSAA